VVNFTNVEVLNFTDPATAKNYAYLAYNAYFNTTDSNFIPVAGNTTPFGWQDPGVRGYYTTFQEQSLVVISFKGTSIQHKSGVVSTVAPDKANVSSPLPLSPQFPLSVALN
jgi:putative lipase involved disintegration of autophagic bodies